MKTCVVCEREFPVEACTVVTLSAEEEASLVKRGIQPVEEFAYCGACWRLIKDPETGPRLLRGTAERQMLRLGVEPLRAKRICDRYYSRLLELQRGRLHKMQS